jgi:hypothetical protein
MIHAPNVIPAQSRNDVTGICSAVLEERRGSEREFLPVAWLLR